jgi:hypothetical protein
VAEPEDEHRRGVGVDRHRHHNHNRQRLIRSGKNTFFCIRPLPESEPLFLLEIFLKCRFVE